MSAVDALEQLMQSLPMTEIANMQDDHPVRTWFKPTVTDPSITPAQTPWLVNGLSTNDFVNYERVNNDGDTSMAVDSAQTIQNCQKKLQKTGNDEGWTLKNLYFYFFKFILNTFKLERPSPAKPLHWDTETTPSSQNGEKIGDNEDNMSHQGPDDYAMEDDNVTGYRNQQTTLDECELLHTCAYN